MYTVNLLVIAVSNSMVCKRPSGTILPWSLLSTFYLSLARGCQNVELSHIDTSLNRIKVNCSSSLDKHDQQNGYAIQYFR